MFGFIQVFRYILNENTSKIIPIGNVVFLDQVNNKQNILTFKLDNKDSNRAIWMMWAWYYLQLNNYGYVYAIFDK